VPGRVFAVAGAKGGVGKTTTTLDLAAALANAGHAVVVVEADLAMANAVDFLDLPAEAGSGPTLHDVLADTTPVSEATYAAPGGFDIVPSGVDLAGFAAAGIESLDPVVEQLRPEYDAVLIDTPAGVTRETLYPVEIADETVLVSTPRAASVRDADKTVEMIERLGGTVRGVVFTRSGAAARAHRLLSGGRPPRRRPRGRRGPRIAGRGRPHRRARPRQRRRCGLPRDRDPAGVLARRITERGRGRPGRRHRAVTGTTRPAPARSGRQRGASPTRDDRPGEKHREGAEAGARDGVQAEPVQQGV